jgi:hypothetical protein
MMLHDFIASGVALLCLWAIISPNVPTGIWGTIGLGLIATAALWSLDDSHNPWGAFEMAIVGVGFVLGGVAWRVWAKGRAARRLVWQETQPAEIDAAIQRHVQGGKGGT